MILLTCPVGLKSYRPVPGFLPESKLRLFESSKTISTIDFHRLKLKRSKIKSKPRWASKRGENVSRWAEPSTNHCNVLKIARPASSCQCQRGKARRSRKGMARPNPKFKNGDKISSN